ncbi:MAG: outer membrane beta-barrel family protein [Muribaculaceae bacterium]|nr:outer membrane beta-barrel family protein [Muribaculaceae bacterium]
MKSVLTIIILISLICAQSLCAQIKLFGQITDTSEQPLEAMVFVVDDGKIVAHTLADESGTYTLEFNSTSDSVTIKASMLGYTPLKKDIAASSCRVDLVLQGGNTLKEFVVVADKITERGDTLSFNVGAYQDKSDRVIGDVIKKMPGLEVSESGRISFNGKQVKNFYVEDMDLLQGRYGIATNNVSANDVASVQVYQNHQPIRALKDIIPSEDITINLKLKSSAKGTWTVSAMGGGGYKPALWAAELTAMYFGKKVQNITTYKGNNSGIDVNSELKSKTDNDQPMFLNKAPLSVAIPTNPGIATRRYIDNKSNTLSINQLIKTDSLSTVTLNLGFYNDQLRKSGQAISQQFEPVSGTYRSIYKELTACNYINSLSSATNFKRNDKSLYIDNSLNIKANWNHDNGTAITTSSFTSGKTMVDQHLDNPSIELSDKLNFIKNNGKHAWEMYLSAGWNHKPQTLSVGGDINDLTQSENLIQNYTTDAALANLFTSRSLLINKVRLYTGIFTGFNMENVRSELDGMQLLDKDLMQNDFLFGKFNIGIQPKVSYPIGNFYAELNLSATYNLQWLKDRIDQSRATSWNYFILMPQVHLTYKMGRNWLALDVNYNRMRDNSQRAAKGVVMTDYLAFRQSEIESTIKNETWLTSLYYYFSNPFNQIFGNTSLTWNQFKHNNITGYEYDGLTTVSVTLPLRNTSNQYSANVNLNKGFGFWNTTVKIGANASLYKGNSLIDESLFAFSTKTWSGSILISTTPASWMSGALAFAYGENRSETKGLEVDSPWVRNWTGRADFNFYLMRNLILNVAAEDNYTNLTSNYRHIWFGDAKITYRQWRFDLCLAVNNIFNRKSFTKVSYTAMDIYTSTYKLRERNVMLTVRMKIL